MKKPFPIIIGILACFLIILFYRQGIGKWAWALMIFLWASGATAWPIILMRKGREGLAIALLLASLAGMIMSFAFLHQLTGLALSDEKNLEPTTLEDATYFSVVTWTTLGYGDLRPRPEGRLIASTEAIVGYIYMGFFIAFIFYFAQQWFGGLHDEESLAETGESNGSSGPNPEEPKKEQEP